MAADPCPCFSRLGMYFFRSLSALCAVSALIAAAFWIGDRITHTSFTQGWILFSSLLWMAVFWAIYRYLKKKQPRA